MSVLGVFVLKKCFLWFLWVFFCAVNSTKLLMIKVPKLKYQNSIQKSTPLVEGEFLLVGREGGGGGNEI